MSQIPSPTYRRISFSREPEIQCMWIPGWGGSSWSLLPFAEKFGFGTHFLFDHIHARQLERGTALSIEDMAHALRAALPDEISSFHLVGISMGGLISAVLANLPELNIRSLHLCCTNTGGLGGHRPISESASTRWWEPIKKGEDPLRKILGLCVSKKFRASDEFEEYLTHCSQIPTPVTGSTLKMQWNAIGNFSSLPFLEKTKIPSFLYEGEEDAVVATGEGERLLESLKPLSRHILPGGHLFFLEDFESFHPVFYKNIQYCLG